MPAHVLAVLWIGLGELPGWSALAWGFVVASAIVHRLYFTCLIAGCRARDLTVVYPVARHRSAAVDHGSRRCWVGSCLVKRRRAGALPARR